MKYPIPKEVFEQHVAILAKTGRGKTVAAKGAAARTMKDQMRVGVVDPTAAWWGMRLKADGSSPAFPMVIFGGDHGDIAIDKRMGEKIGALVAGSDWSWIIDISKMGVDDRTPFMTAFAEALFASNRRRLNLFLDECHLYMPQQKLPTRASSHMTLACNNLVSGGRSRGLCVTMISQRSAKVHKDSLTQAEALITLGMIAPHDIAAVEGWVKVQGDIKAASAMLKSLPALPVGEGYIYAPELGLLDRVKFPMVDTFDSSRAPGIGDDMRAPTDLGQINLDEIKAKLEPPKPAKIDLPKPTHRREHPTGNPVNSEPKSAHSYPSEGALERAENKGWREGQESVRAQIPKLLDAQHLVSFQMGVDWCRGAAVLAAKAIPNAELVPSRKSSQKIRTLTSQHVPPAPASSNGRTPDFGSGNRGSTPRAGTKGNGPALVGDSTLTGPQRTFLQVLRWWEEMGHDSPTRAQAAAVARWKVTAGHINNVSGSLRSAGLIDYPSPGHFRLTEQGRAVAPAPDMGTTLLDGLRSTLSGPQKTVLDAMLDGRDRISRRDLCDVLGWNPTAGHINNILGSLCTLQVIDYPARGEIELQEWVK